MRKPKQDDACSAYDAPVMTADEHESFVSAVGLSALATAI
jgi:hypothetical protein